MVEILEYCMDEQQRKAIVRIVVVAVFFSYILVPFFTALDLNPTDPLYFEEEYRSVYKHSINAEEIGLVEVRYTGYLVYCLPSCHCWRASCIYCPYFINGARA